MRPFGCWLLLPGLMMAGSCGTQGMIGSRDSGDGISDVDAGPDSIGADPNGSDPWTPGPDGAGDPGLPPADSISGDSGHSGDGDGGPAIPPEGWLHTSGNQIRDDQSQVWHGRGANVHDTRSCNACSWLTPNVGEVKRRIDELVDNWGANFLRLDMESYASDDGYRVHWKPITDDAAYLADIREIVDHVGQKPGVYLLLSFWVDPTFSDLGWPTANTRVAWQLMAETFAQDGHVMFGLCNEPEENWDGAQDGAAWTAMNETVQTIRDVEDGLGTPHHLIAVQGTGGWARRLDYYVTHPITAAGGDNIVYEVHVYNPQSDYDAMVLTPAATLPVIIGEFGPWPGVGDADHIALMDLAELLEVPYLAWTFHMRCSPDLLVDNSAGGCGEGMTLTPTDWGHLLKSRLAIPW